MFNSKTWHVGEKLAADYLKRNGYKILLTNDKLAGSEVDIVALFSKKRVIGNLKSDYKTGKLQKQSFEAAKKQATDIVVFIEVKARSSTNFGRPEEAVTPAKQAHIKRYARAFLAKNKLDNVDVRFDVVSVLLGQNVDANDIEHIENAF